MSDYEVSNLGFEHVCTMHRVTTRRRISRLLGLRTDVHAIKITTRLQDGESVMPCLCHPFEVCYELPYAAIFTGLAGGLFALFMMCCFAFYVMKQPVGNEDTSL